MDEAASWPWSIAPVSGRTRIEMAALQPGARALDIEINIVTAHG